MSTVTARATRWEHGWELTLEGEDEVSTQVSTLAKARQQVRDYLDTIDPDTDHSAWEVVVTPESDALAARVAAARRATRDAAEAQARAAREARKVVSDLKAEQFRDSEIAAFLDVSRGRVHQLAS